MTEAQANFVKAFNDLSEQDKSEISVLLSHTNIGTLSDVIITNDVVCVQVKESTIIKGTF